MQSHNGSDKGTASNFVQILAETLAVIRQAFGEECMSCTQEVQTHRDQKEVTQVKSKVKSMIIIFFGIKGIDFSQIICPGRRNNRF
jgi:hypothetical protein